MKSLVYLLHVLSLNILLIGRHIGVNMVISRVRYVGMNVKVWYMCSRSVLYVRALEILSWENFDKLLGGIVLLNSFVLLIWDTRNIRMVQPLVALALVL